MLPSQHQTELLANYIYPPYLPHILNIFEDNVE